MIDPRPPNRLVPPITTAVIEFDIGRLPGLRANPADAPDEHPGGDRADKTGDRIDGDQRSVGVDAGKSRRIRIVAGRIDVASEGGAIEHVPDDHRQQHHQQRCRR